MARFMVLMSSDLEKLGIWSPHTLMEEAPLTKQEAREKLAKSRENVASALRGLRKAKKRLATAVDHPGPHQANLAPFWRKRLNEKKASLQAAESKAAS